VCGGTYRSETQKPNLSLSLSLSLKEKKIQVLVNCSNMSGKGAKGLTTGKTPSSLKDKDKKKPTSRSSRAGLQVLSLSLSQFSPFSLSYLGSASLSYLRYATYPKF
jgi:hypothetical protein